MGYTGVLTVLALFIMLVCTIILLEENNKK